MRRRASGLAWLALGVSGCAPDGGAVAVRPVVVVSVAPQAYFVERLAGEAVEVAVMVPPGANPATHSPTMTQMKAVSRARLYFKIGHPGFPFEGAWLDRLIAEAGAPAVVDGSRGAACAGEDPHIWLSPACVRTMAADLAPALAALVPAERARIETGLAAFGQELDGLEADIRRELAGGLGGVLLVQHPSWGSFARDFGFEQLAIEDERKEPSPTELAAVIEAARAQNVRDVIAQPQHSPLAARAVAEELGGGVILVDPLAEDWAANLRHAARVFAEVLAPTRPPPPA